MTDDDLDLRLRGWFRAEPIALSADALDQVSREIAVRPQRRSARRFGGPIASTRPRVGGRRRDAPVLLALAAVVVVALVGMRVASAPDVATPSGSPGPTATVAAPDPTLLAGGWSSRASDPSVADGLWELTLGEWSLVSRSSIGGDGAAPFALWLRPKAIVGDEVRMEAPVGGACVGVPATYRWTVDGNDRLHLDALDDACAERRTALAERDWHRSWTGTQRSGQTYRTTRAPVQVSLTVPDGLELDGTSEPDWFTHIALEPGSSRFILVSVVRQLTVDACDIRRSYQLVEGMTAADVVDHLASMPPLEVTQRTAVTLDDRPAIRFRIRVDREATTDCHLGIAAYWADPGNPVLVSTGGAQQGQLSTGGTTEEMTILDVDGEVVAITAQAPTAVFDDWLATIGPMIESARFGD